MLRADSSGGIEAKEQQERTAHGAGASETEAKCDDCLNCSVYYSSLHRRPICVYSTTSVLITLKVYAVGRLA